MSGLSNMKVSYIENGTFKPNSSKIEDLDGYHLYCEGFVFRKKKTNKDGSKYWKCRHEKCKSTITIKNGCVVRFKSHDIVTPAEAGDNKELIHIAKTPMDLVSIDFENKVKIRASTEDVSGMKIYNEEFNELVSTGYSVAELSKVLKPVETMMPNLNKRRCKVRPKLPQSLKEIKLEDEYSETMEKKKFLILQSKGSKILVFASPTGIEVLSKSSHWAADGTFHVASKYFYQLYIIQAWYKQRMIPCVYSLMHRRRTVDYEIVLNAVLKEAKNLNFELKPTHEMTDFEAAAINAFKNKFTGIENKGCMFHLAQSLLRNLGKCNLKDVYNKDESFKRWVKTIFVMSIVPTAQVDYVWSDLVLSRQPSNVSKEKVDKFLKYVVDTYFEGKFPIKLWNHYDSVGVPRTNNNLEGFEKAKKKNQKSTTRTASSASQQERDSEDSDLSYSDDSGEDSDDEN